MRSLAPRLRATSRAALLVSFLTVTLGSCEQGIAPDGRLMVYVLQSIEGDALPARPYASNDPVVIADSLIFYADGKGSERMVTRWEHTDTALTSTFSFNWSSDGTRMDMWSWCLGNGFAPCPSGPTFGGLLEGKLWLVTASHRYPIPMVFRRVD